MALARRITWASISRRAMWSSAGAQYHQVRVRPSIELPEIAFASQRDGNWEIYVMDAAGRNQTAHPARCAGSIPTWSPDGAQIAFGSQVDSAWELWVMDSNGARESHLYSQIVAKSARGWSRDGKRIAFAAVADGNIDVYTVDVESTRVIG